MTETSLTNETSKATPLTEMAEARYASRWRALCVRSSVVDHEKAVLAADVRRCFPTGPSGALQFRQCIIEIFDVKGGTAKMLERAAAATRRFDAASWCLFGGWMGIGLVESLLPHERKRVVARCREVAAELGHNLTPTRVRTLAYDLGIRSRNLAGRPTQSDCEKRVDILRRFIASLALPTLPPDVTIAMGKNRLNGLLSS